MRLENFNREFITEEQFDLLPDTFGIDIWESKNQEQFVSLHGNILILSESKEIFVSEDNEWRTLPTERFILTPKN